MVPRQAETPPQFRRQGMGRRHATYAHAYQRRAWYSLKREWWCGDLHTYSVSLGSGPNRAWLVRAHSTTHQSTHHNTWIRQNQLPIPCLGDGDTPLCTCALTHRTRRQAIGIGDMARNQHKQWPNPTHFWAKREHTWSERQYTWAKSTHI
jgi:hypothetical protein